MASNVFTYDPAAVHLTVGGLLIGGFAEDEFIEVERDADAYTKFVGAGGEVARIKNANRAGKVVVRLMMSSPSNDEFSALAELDEFADLGAVPILLRDQNGFTLWSSVYCWVKKLPKTVWKKDVEVREWTLDTGRLLGFVGGIAR